MTAPQINSDPHRPQPAPVKYAGQWVAWDKGRSVIVAHGMTLSEVQAAAVSAGHPDAVLQKVRRPGTSFIGAT